MSQEAAFNAGRAAHHLNLNHLASHHYLQVLQEQQQQQGAQQVPSLLATDDAVAAGPLQHEAAHNLAMIYAASGSMGLAKDIYRTFMVIV